MMISVKNKRGGVWHRTLVLLLSFAIIFTTFGAIPAYAQNDDDVNQGTLAELRIACVEELTRGDRQVLYRDEVYQGVEENGENPEKYYTTYRNINLKDPRIFYFEFPATVEQVGQDPDAFLQTVSLRYGGLSLDKWVWDGYESRVKPKDTSVLKLKDKSLQQNDDGTYTVKLAMETETAWATVNNGTNVPYENYGAGRQFDFSTGQSADNRAWWQAGPLKKGVGTYEMTAMIGETAVAARDMHIAPYDGMHSWIEINEYAQRLIKALNGTEYPKEKLDGQTTGLIASGYIALDQNGTFVRGNSDEHVYVEVSVLGYGLTDNDKPENKSFNNYSKFNAIWNIVVAKDEETVTRYLNETVPAMNTNPQELIDQIKGQDDADIDLMQVFYQNNVHPDEVSGTDTMIKLTTDLIKGGQAGQKIAYKSWQLEDMDLQYRDPAEGATQGTRGHVVKGGFEGELFNNPAARTDKEFDTKEALDNFIFVNTLCSNPDGKAGMRRTNRYAFDLNRDAVFSTMPEAIALMKDIMKWDPLVENEWHGYVANMLIEPCTAPHDPAYDYDLLQNNMLNLAYAAGLAATGSSGMERFLIPWDHYDGGDWDDGGTIYSPMFAMLLGCYGYTIELPYSNLDSLDANDVINYAMIDELLHGTTEFFGGNRLNGPLEDVNGKTYDSHEGDIIDISMRKATLIGKLQTKARGLANIDAKDTVDKYFIDKKKNAETGAMEDKVVGRARPVDANGKELSFFPDYIVIPTDEKNQYNVAEGLKAMNQMLGWKIEVQKSTDAVEYDGKKIPAGAYVIDMKQSRRNVIFEVMSKGYDATGFSGMYADIYCNLPDVRGFDSIQVYGKGLFDGKLENVEVVPKEANITGEAAEYIVFDSQSTDAVRFVNLLLSGYSSGPSYADKGTVWMLRKTVKGIGNASDYVIKASDLEKIHNLTKNAVLGLNGCHIEGKYIAELPKEAVKLVEPTIQLNTVRTSQSGGPLWWMLDEYLGFKSMTNYNGNKDGVRKNANVIISNSSTLDTAQINEVKKGVGIIFIRNVASLNDANFGIGSPAAKTGSFADVALNGQYNVDDSLFTMNYQNTSTYYARGNKYYDLPKGAKILFQSRLDKEDAFIGGFQATSGEKETFANAVTMFSTIIENDAKPAQVLAIGQYLDYRPHYQKLLPILATAIYASAAGIYDDFNAPVIEEPKYENGKYAVSAKDGNHGYAESGVKKLSVYLEKNGESNLIGEASKGSVYFQPSGEKMQLKAIAVDYAGNETMKTFVVDGSIPTPPSGGGSGYVPSIQKPEIEIIGKGKAQLSPDGTMAELMPEEGYEVQSVMLNGKEMGKIIKLTGLKTGDKAVVTFAAKAADKETMDKMVSQKVAKMSLMARSSKTAKKNIRVLLRTDAATAAALNEIQDLGYTVKYKFYRSVKKSAKYSAKLTKMNKRYINTTGKKGTMYYYKARIMVYDQRGILIAKTELRQCKYANRRWSR